MKAKEDKEMTSGASTMEELKDSDNSYQAIKQRKLTQKPENAIEESKDGYIWIIMASI